MCLPVGTRQAVTTFFSSGLPPKRAGRQRHFGLQNWQLSGVAIFPSFVFFDRDRNSRSILLLEAVNGL